MPTLRGFAYTSKGDLDRAIGDYDQAIRLNPKMPSHTSTEATPGQRQQEIPNPSQFHNTEFFSL
jgi:hypothetical protein